MDIDQIERLKPMEIEQRSFEIISQEAGDAIPDDERAMIIKRVIHTSADFDYIQNLCFSENAVQIAQKALKNGAWIVTDTKMALSGINKKSLQLAGGRRTALFRMKISHRQQRSRGRPGHPSAWIRRHGWDVR